MNGPTGFNTNQNGLPTAEGIPVTSPISTTPNNSANEPMNIPTGNVIPNMTSQNSTTANNPILGLTQKNEVTYADVIGSSMKEENNQTNQGFFNSPTNTSLNVENNPVPSSSTSDSSSEDNQFINMTGMHQDTHLNDLNVDGSYNNLEAPDYATDEQVKKNINEYTKKTVPVSNELKVVIIIAVLMLIFILFMPELGDLLRNIKLNLPSR